MKEIHSLLKRQIKRHLKSIDTGNIPEAWARFITSVNESYCQMDEDRKMLERSLDISSQELLDANSEMKELFQTFPDLLFRTDFGGTILDYSASSATDLPFFREGVIGKQIRAIFPANVGKKLSDAIDTLRKKRSLVSTEFSIAGHDGEHSYEARLLPLLESQVVIIIRDITDRKLVQEALRESAEKYRQLAETSHDLILTADLNFNIMYANKAALDFTGGIDPVGMSLIDFTPPHLRQHHPEMMQKRREGVSDMWSFEWEIVHPAGAIATFDTRSTLLTADGKPSGVMFVGRDITKRKRAEEALRESEGKYRQLAEKSHDIIVAVDLNFKITYANKATLDFIGGIDLVGMSLFDFIPPHWHQLQLEIMNKRREGFSDVMIYEWEIVHPAGKIATFDAHGTLLTQDGKPSGVIFVARDITGRKRVEDELRDSEEKYRSLASSADLMFLVDRDCKYLFMNEMYAERLDLPIEKFIGRPYGDFHSEESTRVFSRIVGTVLSTGESSQHDYKSEIDGRVFLQTFSPVKDRGGKAIIAVTVLSKDITERKQAEEALEKREKELVKKAGELEDVNAALRVLLERRQQDKYELEEMVLQNVKTNVIPYLETLKKNLSASREITYVGIIESNIEKIISPFSQRLSSKYQDLTPKEIQVANLIREGKSTKDIAEILNLSYKAIDTRRHNIRSKLGLKNKKTNLHAYLSTLS
jgi:PAS domain S-box-containing protein